MGHALHVAGKERARSNVSNRLDDVPEPVFPVPHRVPVESDLVTVPFQREQQTGLQPHRRPDPAHDRARTGPALRLDAERPSVHVRRVVELVVPREVWHVDHDRPAALREERKRDWRSDPRPRLQDPGPALLCDHEGAVLRKPARLEPRRHDAVEACRGIPREHAARVERDHRRSECPASDIVDGRVAAMIPDLLDERQVAAERLELQQVSQAVESQGMEPDVAKLIVEACASLQILPAIAGSHHDEVVPPAGGDAPDDGEQSPDPEPALWLVVVHSVGRSRE